MKPTYDPFTIAYGTVPIGGGNGRFHVDQAPRALGGPNASWHNRAAPGMAGARSGCNARGSLTPKVAALVRSEARTTVPPPAASVHPLGP